MPPQTMDALGNTTITTYDAVSNTIAVTDPLNHTTTTTYDGVGNVIGITDALNRTTEYVYDGLNRPTQTVDAIGNTTVTAYDKVGNTIAVTDPLGQTTSLFYDDLDRQISVLDPLDRETITEYDANSNVTSITDALGNVTQYSYDGNDRQITTTDAQGETTTTTYDPEGNILSVTDPGGNTTSYTYDELYRLLTETDQLGNVRSYAYDAVGNQTQSIDANNRIQQFVYDDLNRRTEEQWLDESSNPIRTITFDYDAASQLKEVSDQDSTYKYTYDESGRLTSVDNAGTPGVPNVVLDYTYDDVNNLLSVTETIDGEASGIESFVYDDLNRVIQTTQTGAGVTDKRVDFEYDNAYRMTEVTRYSDLAGTIEVATSDYDYDIANRLRELTHKKGDNIIAEYDWSYDAVNRLIGLESVDGSSSFSYDELDQLTDAEYSFQSDENYSYDENGNRTNSGYETEADNQLSSDGTYNYEYDGEGNLIKRTEIATGEVMELSWDYRNRLIAVEVKDSNGDVIESVEYVYDAFDRRLGKIVDADGDGSESAVAERFVYDGHHIALVFDGEGDLVNRYLHGPGIDQVLAQEDGSGEVLWGLTDNQGSVRDVVDDSGEVVNHIVYDGFGGVVSETDSTVEFRFGYTGRELDEETGWYYYRARYYDPQVGRFVSQDPIGFAGGDVNLYGYVGNSPTNFTDPSGLVPLPGWLRRRLGSDPGVYTGLPPWQERDDQYKEAQRQWALNLVKENIAYICEVAHRHYVTPDAIAGTILWEAIENPYNWARGQGPLIFTRPGGSDDYGIAGKIHLDPGSEAIKLLPDLIKVRPEVSGLSQEDLENKFIEDPTLAIESIGLILDRAATLYAERARGYIPGFSIRDQAGVQGALFQGGIDGRLGALADRLYDEKSNYRPQLPEGEKMGPWISQYRWWIRNYVSQCGCEFPSKFDPVPVHPNFDPGQLDRS